MDVDKERKKPKETLEVYKLYQKSHPGKEKEIFAHLKERNKTEYRDKISVAEVIRWVKLYIIT